jgi:hypothetical protein
LPAAIRLPGACSPFLQRFDYKRLFWSNSLTFVMCGRKSAFPRLLGKMSECDAPSGNAGPLLLGFRG